MRRAAAILFLLAPTDQAAVNRAHDLLMQSTEEDRRLSLAAAVRSSGFPCTGTETFFQGFGPSGEAFWNVRCHEGTAYSIAIYADTQASFSVLECGVLARKVRIECFRSLDDQH
jgi:hypothetical protein